MGKEDHKVYSNEEMEQYGANFGLQLYTALDHAATRGVHIRIIVGSLQHSKELPQEVVDLVQKHPNTVETQLWDASKWYGGGIMHQKLWIFDRRAAYVGSSNTDWKSLSQVMELGLLIQDSTELIDDLDKLFQIWWQWSSLNHSRTTTYWSNKYQAMLKAPSWSHDVPFHDRESIPFSSELATRFNRHHQLKTKTTKAFIAASPRDVVVIDRTFDEEALVYTIRSATKSVCLSVMDFQSTSVFPLQNGTDQPIWWPALTDAILSVVYAKQVHVKMLISHWQHTSKDMIANLVALQQMADGCKTMRLSCAGSLEIRLFQVPGWNQTIPTGPQDKPHWPAYSRVNHAKYIVTDKRVNIGTSNMQWGYFHTTAGISVNLEDTHIRETVQKIFNRNWASSYVVPLTKDYNMN